MDTSDDIAHKMWSNLIIECDQSSPGVGQMLSEKVKLTYFDVYLSQMTLRRHPSWVQFVKIHDGKIHFGKIHFWIV